MLVQISFVLSQITRSSDGRADRQTDGRTDSFIVARPRCIQCMQRGKKRQTLNTMSEKIAKR